jgi:DNA topoisomerase-1
MMMPLVRSNLLALASVIGYPPMPATSRRKRTRPRVSRRRPPKPAAAPPPPQESAAEAGLRYVSDTSPGIRRKRSGTGFTYVGQDGKRITDQKTVERIRKLAIPPAYTDVWICPSPNGHLQATGRDARGRKQYRYHPRWREVRDETKFGRMVAFSEVLPRLRARVEADLGRAGLPREKVLATVVRLLECTNIRVGNDEYVRANGSYGLTTLKDKHVEVSGGSLRFSFTGKSGKTHEVELSDRRLARIVQRCRDVPGEELFQYLDDDGARQTIGSGDVNDYLREISGQEFTAKDFRTWAGTMLAVRALRDLGPMDTEREAKSAIVRAVDQVAEQLNNTRAVCRKYYIHPTVLETYLAGTMLSGLGNGTRLAAAAATGSALNAEEKALVRLLNGRN